MPELKSLDADPRKALQLTEKLSEILVSAGVVPAAHPLLALTRLRTSLLIGHFSRISQPGVEEIYSPQLQHEHQAPSNQDAQQALDDAIRSATRANTGISQILTYGHPVRGVSLAELGKLLSVDEPSPKDIENGSEGGVNAPLPPPTSKAYPPSGPSRLRLALETLIRARAELLVGFGGGANEGGQVGREVREQIVRVEKELNVWRNGIRNAIQDSELGKKKEKKTGSV